MLPWHARSVIDTFHTLQDHKTDKYDQTVEHPKAFLGGNNIMIWKKISEVPIFGPDYNAGQGETKVAILKGFQQK